jgi:hypothetical protein
MNADIFVLSVDTTISLEIIKPDLFILVDPTPILVLPK